MNKIELAVAMVRRGVSITKLADIIGIDRTTLHRKLQTGKFERSEIIKIRDTLQLEDADMLRIFFDDADCVNATKSEEDT